MAKTTRTLDGYLDAWESKRMSGGRALTDAEHVVVLEVGELVARLRLPADITPELMDILRRFQNDAAGALQFLAERFQTSAIELDLYRRSWRDVHDAAFERLLQLRVSAMQSRGADQEKIHNFKTEICSWRDQLARTRRDREQARADRAQQVAAEQARLQEIEHARQEAQVRVEAEARLVGEEFIDGIDDVEVRPGVRRLAIRGGGDDETVQGLHAPLLGDEFGGEIVEQRGV